MPQGYHYLKQVKQRSTAELYGSHNVCLGRLERQNGFLKFVFSHTDNEVKHLRRYSQMERQRRAADVLSLHKQGLSQRQIAGRLEMSLSAVRVAGDEGAFTVYPGVSMYRWGEMWGTRDFSNS